MKPTVLIVEDDHDLREALVDTLDIGGYETIEAENGRHALQQLENSDIDLVVSDIMMDEMDGHTLLRRIKSQEPDLPVLMMTAYGTIQSAVQAMQEGATDYLVKPFEAEVLVSRISQLISNQDDEPKAQTIAVDARTKEVLALAHKVATSDATVMIAGESGTGKEILFRYIHEHSSRSSKQPIALNCAAIPENMLEAILFGYEKGAFTGAYKSSLGKFELAQGSTLLLDEVSEMSLSLQAKLLRVLQEKQVERLGSNKLIELDVRVVATSNRDLKEYVKEGKFREDLYYRLNVFPIRMPALRERPLDIMPLAKYLLRHATDAEKPVVAFSDDARKMLEHYSWPGNVRELDNVIQRASIIHQGDEIKATDLLLEINQPTSINSIVSNASINDENLGDDLKAREQQLIVDALDEGKGSRKFAAEKLGISPRTLRYKIARMKEAGIDVPER